jgi:hypothetical protein
LSVGQQIVLWESNNFTSTNFTNALNDNNHLIVLVNTPLYWTEFPQNVMNVIGAKLVLEGEDFNVEITNLTNFGTATIASIEEKGQHYFVMTGTSTFRGSIAIVAK